MSIINQTLRELDARQPSRSAALTRSPAVVRRGGQRVAVAAFALLPVVAALAWLTATERGDGAQTRANHAEPGRSGSRAAPHTVPAIPVAAEVAVPLRMAAAAVPPRSDTVAVAAAIAEPAPAESSEAEAPPPPQEASVPAPTARPNRTAAPSDSARDALIRKDFSRPRAEEEAETRYRKALAFARSGREVEARTLLDEAVRLAPRHVAARQLLATSLHEAGRAGEAEAVLTAGYRSAPDNPWFALSLARLQAERGHVEAAVATLLDGIDNRAVDAEYRATLAALLLRLDRPGEAARQYEESLRVEPERGRWWMGLGLALEGEGKTAAARTAYGRALATRDLPEKLVEFVRTKVEHP